MLGAYAIAHTGDGDAVAAAHARRRDSSGWVVVRRRDREPAVA